MDVTMPDGTVIQGVPDGTTKSQLLAKYQKFQGASSQTKPSESDSGFLNDLGRSAAMQGGAFIKGAANVVALPSDTLVRLINMIPGVNIGAPASEQINAAIDSVTPQPRNATERVTNKVVESIGGAGGGIGLGRMGGGIVGRAIAAQPGGQLAAGATGATASQLTAEAGGGPKAQMAAGLVGALAPGAVRAGIAGTAKGIARGGEAGRQRVNENITSFERSGTMPSMGQATQTRRMQASESALSRAPGSAGVMANRAEAQGQQLAAGVERQAATLAPRSSAEQAGRAINQGVDGFSQYIHRGADQLYNIVDQHIPAQTPIAVTNTQRFLNQTTAPIAGAPNTSQLLANPRMGEIHQALGADIAAAASGQLPYEAVRALRTRVGEAIAGAGLINDVPTGQLRRLYGTLSTDLQAAAHAQGPVAARAATRANNFYRAGMRRLEVVSSVVERNGGPEAVFKAATSGTKEGATTLRAVLQSLPPEGQRMVTATVLRRMGRANPGQQNELGERFSTETFLTNWNSMSPAARSTMFDRYGPQFSQSMDQLARVAANLRGGSRVFSNPSGTGQATAQIGAIASFLTALGTGNVGVAGGIAGGVAGANLSARLLTNPNAVRWLGQRTRAPVGAIPALIGQLNRSNDEDLQELGQFLSQQNPSEPSQ